MFKLLTFTVNWTPVLYFMEMSSHLLACVPIIYIIYKLTTSVFHFIFYKSPLCNLPGPKPLSWLTGNLNQLFNRKGLSYHHGLVEQYGGMVKVYGFFGDEQLYISDPQALHSILVKDQDSFEETSVFIETNKIIFGEGLVATTGHQHRRQRKITGPVFSVAQLREVTPVFYEVANKLAGVIADQAEEISRLNGGPPASLDMAEWMSRVALETIGRTLLGYSFDPLDSPYNNPYTAAIKELIPSLFSLSLLRQLTPFLAHLGPTWFRRTLVDFIPVPLIQKIKNMSDVMYTTAQGILRTKIRDLTDGNKQRYAPVFDEDPVSLQGRDIISVLLKANDRASNIEKLSEDELIGQMTVLIFGAQDTTSSALSRMLYMLARHPDIQDNVRREIQTALEHTSSNFLGYDEILALPWLDAVVKETLRLYPPVPFVRRTAIETRTVPLSQPICTPNGLISSVTIPEGTTLFVAIAAANRLESVWGSDAREWKPSRWLSGDFSTKAVRLPSIYSGMMTFLAGNRSCIGYKFAQIEIKILLVTLISKFRFSPTDDQVVWNLSQIISPSIRLKDHACVDGSGAERQGLPLIVQPILSQDQ